MEPKLPLRRLVYRAFLHFIAPLVGYLPKRCWQWWYDVVSREYFDNGWEEKLKAWDERMSEEHHTTVNQIGTQNIGKDD